MTKDEVMRRGKVQECHTFEMGFSATRQLWSDLQRYAGELNVPMSFIIRTAVREWIVQHERDKLRP